jgi:hypothetical protein
VWKRERKIERERKRESDIQKEWEIEKEKRRYCWKVRCKSKRKISSMCEGWREGYAEGRRERKGRKSVSRK